MKNKLWIFGDSFSFGHGCNPGDEYFENYKNHGKKFPDIVSENLDIEYELYAETGASNATILRWVVESIHKFNEGDLVIVNYTDAFRYEIPHKDYGVQYVLQHSLEEPVFSEYRPYGDINNAVLNYSKYIHKPGLSVYKKNIQKQFDSIYKFFDKNNIKYCYFDWNSPAFFQNYEPIYKDTKGKIDDFHLSWNGHRDIAYSAIESFKYGNNKNLNLIKRTF